MTQTIRTGPPSLSFEDKELKATVPALGAPTATAEIIVAADGIVPGATYTFEIDDERAGVRWQYGDCHPELREHDVRFDLTKAGTVFSRPLEEARKLHGRVEPNWIPVTRFGSAYEEELDANARPEHFRHRRRGHTGGAEHEWADGPAPDNASKAG